MDQPWDAYNPVEIKGERYYITEINYSFKMSIPEKSVSYEIEKHRGCTKIHVYLMDANGNKEDLGEFRVFEYRRKITPINGPDMVGAFEYRVWVKERSKESDEYFLTPMLNFGITVAGNVVGGEITRNNVADLYDLSSGEGYTVEKGRTVELAGMSFTFFFRKLRPSGRGGGQMGRGIYHHVRAVNIKLEKR